MTSHYKAVRLSRPGGPLSVETLTRQRPGPGEVAVQLRYAGVNPLDGYIRAGAVGSPDTLPRTLGVEGVGELDGQ
ncbi:MAG: zinc-binding alcohol dehydrogenase family protein, partial [Jatrophihabitantaceae bacterium]